MTVLTIPTLEELFETRLTWLDLFKKKLKITTTSELLLFTEQKLRKTPGLVGGDVTFAIDTLQRHKLALRDEDESIKETLRKYYGSISAAPIQSLNFEMFGIDATFSPLKIIRDMHQIDPSILTIEDLRDSTTVDFMAYMDDFEKLTDRMRTLGLSA